jgi:ribonuclease D
MIDFPFEVITDSATAAIALSRIETESLIALDTETYWNPDFERSSVSLVQIAVRDMPVVVLDAMTVNLDVIRPLVESNQVMVAAHNARFDEGMLISEGLKPAQFVDTLRLARLALRLPSYSLASVVDHLFGIKLDKSYQRSNWKRRPLSLPQLKYAALDAHVTLMLFQHLEKLLSEQGRLELGMRAALLDGGPKGKRPRRRIEPMPERDLTVAEQQLLLALKKWRLERSFKRRIPAYMICSDRTLHHLVIELPQKLEDLELIYGMGASRVADFGQELLELLRIPKEIQEFEREALMDKAIGSATDDEEQLDR